MTRQMVAVAIIGIGGMIVFASDASAQIVGPGRRAAAGAAAAAGAPGVGARIEAREAARGLTPGDRWRYVNDANQWWYYTPQHSWMYYRNNAWAPYDAASYTGVAIPAAPLTPAGYGNNPDSWRYVYNGNRWWYYTPQQSWMYHAGAQWAPYQATGPGPRYRTGYRGNYGDYNEPGNPPQVPVDPNARNAAPPAAQSTDQAPALPNDSGQVPGEIKPQAAPQQPEIRDEPRPDRPVQQRRDSGGF
jgi:hypothetical protein